MAKPMEPEMVGEKGYGLFSDPDALGRTHQYGWVKFTPLAARSYLSIRIEGGGTYAHFSGVDELRALARAILEEIGTG